MIEILEMSYCDYLPRTKKGVSSKYATVLKRTGRETKNEKFFTPLSINSIRNQVDLFYEQHGCLYDFRDEK